jgi:hypothetical protein
MKQAIASICGFVIFAASMIAVVLHLFPVGDPHLPGYADFLPPSVSKEMVPIEGNSVALRYNRETADDIGVSSVICGIILDYRGYDTIYESTVLFTASIGVLTMLSMTSGGKKG